MWFIASVMAGSLGAPTFLPAEINFVSVDAPGMTLVGRSATLAPTAQCTNEISTMLENLKENE